MSEAVRNLMAMPDDAVSAKYIAPILKMNAGVIVKHAKDGTWDQEHLGKYVISGNRVKFFRTDFLVKCGYIKPEKEKPTVEQLLMEIRDELKRMNKLTLAGMDFQQRLALELMNDAEKENAGAATPTL